MKRKVEIACVVLLSILPFYPAAAQSGGLSAIDILNRVDDSVNGPVDQSYTLTIVLTDRFGAEKTQELVMLQKGRDKRLARVLSPAGQRGIAFLTLPDGVQYLYLPAFGKAQRLDSRIKTTSFSGTDFTYEDMEAGRQSDRWDPRFVRRDGEAIVLEMTPKPGRTSDYSKLVMWVRSDSFVPVRVEHYDKAGNLYKVLVRDRIQQVQGYWVAMEMTMEDLKRKHKTRMVISDVEFDTGLSDDRFTDRAMAE